MKNSIKLFLLTGQLIFMQTSLHSQLSGSFTIGTGGNYPTITSAVNTLVSGGVNGPVIFNLFSGTYYESVSIDSISGSSAANTITFQSMTGNNSDVTLVNSSGSTNYIIKINGADYVQFKNLTFSASIIREIYLIGYIDNLIFTHNKFAGTSCGIYSDNALLKNFLAQQNSFNIPYGIEMDLGTNISTGTNIIQNDFLGVRCLSFLNHVGLNIESNIIKTNAGPSNGIYLLSCNGVLKIVANKILSYTPVRDVGANGISLYSCSGAGSVIANNFIQFDYSSGIYLSNCSNQNIYFNTLFGNGRYTKNFNFTNCSNILLRNNISRIASKGPYGSWGFYFSTINAWSSNYNLIINPDNPFGVLNGTTYNNLAAWNAGTGQDLNSNYGDVAFVDASINDLHIASASIGNPSLQGIPIAGITTDIDGDPRNPIHPYIGADEPGPITVSLRLFIEGYFNENSNFQTGDTIRAYLRSSGSPYNLIDSAVSYDSSSGNAVLKFPNSFQGTYYLVVRHRNSIETWSKNGIVMVSAVSYDFTNAVTQAYGDNLTIKGSKYCIFSGDVNRNGTIDLNDVIPVYNDAAAFLSGYLQTDLNGDNYADLKDLIIVSNNSNDFVHMIRP